MTWAIIWLTASVSFALGWALRTIMADTRQSRRRIILDWGAAHRLLDRAQVCIGQADLTPRVRWLLDQLAKQVGWPTDRPSAIERHDPRDPMPPEDDSPPWTPGIID